MKTPPPGFTRPDYSTPFDFEARTKGLTPERTIKGFLLQGMLNTAKEAGRPLPGERKYVAFKDYSALDGAKLTVEVAGHLHPEVPIQEGLRRMGRRGLHFLSDSMLGRVILGTVGLKLETLLAATPRIFSQIIQHGPRVSLVEQSSHHACLHYQNFFPDFLDCVQLGVLEGGLIAYGKTHEVFIRKIAAGEAELWGCWE